MKCFQCRAELPEGTRFCTHCDEEQGFSPDLIEKAQKGDEAALSELYRRTYQSVYHTAKALISSEDTILDLVQDTYIKGFRHLHQLQDPNKFRAWIKRIAHNLAVDFLRKTKPVIFSSLPEEESGDVEFEEDRTENLPDAVIDQQEATRLMKEILDSLSEAQRVAVIMFYYERMSLHEIAQTLQVSENTVKSRLLYARKKIETEVRALEKKGTKLYGLAPIPFLLVLFRNMDVQAVEIPSALLQSVMGQVGSSVSAEGAGTLSANASATAKTSTAVLKAAAGTATKSVITKVVAAIVTVGVIGGAVVGITALNQKEPTKPESSSISAPSSEVSPSEASSLPSENVPKEETSETLSPEDIYHPILDDYRAEMAAGASHETYDSPYVNYMMMDNYYVYGGYDGADWHGFCYDYYDIDQNGTDELLIGYGFKSQADIVDVYGVKNNQPYKLFADHSLGERSSLYVFPDGRMILIGSGGAALHEVIVYRFDENGDVQTQNSDMLDGAFDLEAILAEKSDNQQPVEDFDWKPLEPDADTGTEPNDDIAQYIGTYMNGNGWNAGILTITQGAEPGTVTVTLEAFKNRSDQELSKIFEGTGRLENGGLIIEIDGTDAAVLSDGTYGFFLTPAPQFKQQWQVDPYVFEGEYVSF